MLARLAAHQAGATLGQNVMIDNRGGAAGLIGAASVARAEPDGYTLLMASAAQVTIPPWINRSLTFDPPQGPRAGGAPRRHADGADRRGQFAR